MSQSAVNTDCMNSAAGRPIYPRWRAIAAVQHATSGCMHVSHNGCTGAHKQPVGSALLATLAGDWCRGCLPRLLPHPMGTHSNRLHLAGHQGSCNPPSSCKQQRFKQHSHHVPCILSKGAQPHFGATGSHALPTHKPAKDMCAVGPCQLPLLPGATAHGICWVRRHPHTASQCSACMHHHASASTAANRGSSTSRNKLAPGPAPAGVLALLVLVRKG